MAQIPLNAEGGTAAVVKARMPNQDIERLIKLARRRRKSRSAVTRELLAYALDHLEQQDSAPPP
jgi:Ribbon-helix-helix protein, copG family